eukprot:8387647-Alexandrium_andersonii.AAC.1
MSASLVGSEMCIRDSRQTCARPAPDVHQTCARRAPDVRQTCTRRAPDPVSYTHLTLPTICSV